MTTSRDDGARERPVPVRPPEDPLARLAAALRDVAGIDVALVFGSTAAGTARPDSDIDVLVVGGPSLDRRGLFRQLAEASLEIGREVNTLVYTGEQLAERVHSPRHPAHRFVRNVLGGPTHRLVGRDDALAWLERLPDGAGGR